MIADWPARKVIYAVEHLKPHLRAAEVGAIRALQQLRSTGVVPREIVVALKDRHLSKRNIARNRNADAGLKVRRQPIAIRHVDGQRAVREYDLTRLRIHTARVRHKRGLPRDRVENHHASQALCIPLASRGNPLGVENGKRKTACCLNQTEQFKAAHRDRLQIVSFNHTAGGPIYI